MNQQRGSSISLLSLISGVIIFAVICWLILKIVSNFWMYILGFFVILFIMVLVMNPKAVWNYLKMIGRAFKANTATGLLYSVLSLIGFPVVTLFLLGQTLLQRRLKGHFDKPEEKETFAEYEEVESVLGGGDSGN